jgi:hypothetical protein
VENHNPELWLRITELTKETPYFKEVLNNPAYANLKDDNARINEAFAQAIGDEGERVFHNKDINLSFKDKFKKLLNNFWSWTGEKLGIRDLTPEEISRLTFEPTLKGAIADITDGKPMFPLKIGGVKLTAKQRDVLATGGTIQMTGLINKKGQKFTADMRWNFRENKPEYINGRQIKEPLKEKMKNSYRKKI